MTSSAYNHSDDLGERTGSDTDIREGKDAYGRRVYLVGDTGKWASTFSGAERILHKLNNPRLRADKLADAQDAYFDRQAAEEIIPF